MERHVIRLCVLVALAAVSGGSAFGATLPEEAGSFGREVAKIYDFAPHELNQKQIDQKSKVLDAFWESVTAKPEVFLPLLRAELQSSGRPAFFYFDGSKLLLSLSKTFDDLRVAAGAIENADLRDVQATDYLLTVHDFAVAGLDTTGLAFKILGDPEFKVIIPAHALTLGQDYSLVYLLLPTDEKYYLAKVASRVKTERDPTAAKSLLLVLSYAVAPEADGAIDAVAADDHRSDAIRKQAEKLQTLRVQADPASLKRAAQTQAELHVSASDYCAIKEARRKRLASVSDEALIDLDLLTVSLRAAPRPSKGCM